MVNGNPDKRFFGDVSANPEVACLGFDEIDVDVECRKADFGVELGDVGGKGFLAGIVLEGPWGVEDEPERHFDDVGGTRVNLVLCRLEEDSEGGRYLNLRVGKS
jgi:hypothetical protein